ncbi:glutathione S-transferase family protein [Pseudoduganella armeniaca]|uniref:Glutathione S-transferase n=1 Tax=Pseudoduganella armeniaca TaxID=2072590 RepID=A0A2R4C4Y3_9BURK|nr:glutathione S-transferase N-terminal domain-containing protein [Pseudoduganella armeniaca]AVR94640.1 glutathione S-transferase [Pseudoduganella armeniaca]
MYTAYLADTPNGRKISIALEELGLPYRVQHVDLGAGEQHTPAFERLNPNGKIPVLVNEDDGTPLFESNAILFHLATHSGRLIPADGNGRDTVLQWLFLQAASIGPMLGQLWWFRHAAPAPNEQALARYTKEARRLYGVIERRLAATPYIAGDTYTVADIACWTWLVTHEELGLDIGAWPALAAWLDKVGARPALQRGLARTAEPAHV